jgi:hypothetical protein
LGVAAEALMRHWPEWLFIVLVMVLPFVAAVVLPSGSFVGFLVWVGLGMLVGAALWVGVIWLACR